METPLKPAVPELYPNFFMRLIKLEGQIKVLEQELHELKDALWEAKQ